MRATEIQPRPHLYLDMDGVQADFFTAWAQLHGKERYKEIGDRAAREASISEINARGPEFVYDFFRNLKPLAGGQKLIRWLRTNEIPFTVLSAPLNGNEAASIAGKRAWLDQFNPGTSEQAIFSGEKYQFAQRGGQPNVLVDDFKKYVNSWRDAGGIGILYRDNNVNQIISELARIYNINASQEALDEEIIDEDSFISPGIRHKLEGKGYKYLDSGIDQAAYLTPDKSMILKIFGTSRWDLEAKLSESQLMFIEWAAFCAKPENSKNPYLVKFYIGQGGKPWATFKFEGRNYLQIWQEYLPHNSGSMGEDLESLSYSIDDHGIQIVRDFLNGEVKQPRFSNIQKALGEKGFLLMANTIYELSRIANRQGYDLDLHEGNFRLRSDGTPVIVDPWVAE